MHDFPEVAGTEPRPKENHAPRSRYITESDTMRIGVVHTCVATEGLTTVQPAWELVCRLT